MRFPFSFAFRPQSQRSLLQRVLLVAFAIGFFSAIETRNARAEFLVSASAATTVAPAEGGGYLYEYTITNTTSDIIPQAGEISFGSNLIVWGMPFFDDAATSFLNGEDSIFAPEGWTWIFAELTPGTGDDELWGYVAADDPKNDTYGAPGSAFENPPYALIFLADIVSELTTGIAPGESLGGFGYTSNFTGVNIPFIAAFGNLQLTIGDPVAPRTTNFPGTQQVPEPGSMILLATGGLTLLTVAGYRRRRAS